MPAYGVKNFNQKRLIQARNTRGLSAANLADLVGISPTSVSLYEKGKQNPRQETVDALARTLNVPVGFFFKEINIEKPSNLFYRSMSSATKRSRTISEAKYEWALETIDYLLGFFDFPALNLPDLEVPIDFRKLDSLQIEMFAQQLRECWTLGNGPISNMIRTLESNGIVTWRTLFEADSQDAFSEYRLPHPVVVLSSDKENYFRSRFDAAHELGHLILHRNVKQITLNTKTDFKLIEDQAHLFAAAFLLPATIYARDLFSVKLDAFRALKPRWNVSISMQIMRAKQLGLINEHEQKRMWMNLARRRWKKSEPLDDSTPIERPNLIVSGVKMLIEEGVKSKEQITEDLQFSTSDIEKIIEKPGFIRNSPPPNQPTLKTDNRNIVVPFRRS